MGAANDDAADRWADALGRWAIPPEILARAPESPWTCVPVDFKADDMMVMETPSTPFERAVIPSGGSVLDVGCGGGRASLALAPPASLVIGVDESEAMLAQLIETARARGVEAATHHGRWPDIAVEVPRVDVVVCHHVAYNVPDIVPFLRALTAHAHLAVVLELTGTHPQAVWSAAWQHFWGIERPASPTADDLVSIVRALGWAPEVWRQRRPDGDQPFHDPERALRSTLRRLCLPADRADEVAAYLAAHPLSWPDEVVTLRWPGVDDAERPSTH